MRKVLQWRRLSILLAIILTAALFAFAFRTVALRAMGRALVIDEVVQKSDIIIVPEWAGKAGALEAADLVHAGVSGRVGVVGEPPKASELELTRRRIPFETDQDTLIQVLHNLGITDIIRLADSADGTESEARILPSFCKENDVRSMVLVSTSDHARRVRRALHRSMRQAGATTEIVVKSATFSSFVPDRWWQTRDGTRTEISELGKLVLDVIRHPIS